MISHAYSEQIVILRVLNWCINKVAKQTLALPFHAVLTIILVSVVMLMAMLIRTVGIAHLALQITIVILVRVQKSAMYVVQKLVVHFMTCYKHIIL